MNAKCGQQSIFSDKNTILSYKTIFGPAFRKFAFRIFGGAVFPQVPKNCDFGPKWPFFGTFGQNWPECEVF